ncbi:hypothetical protein ACLMJK_004670 [Lecanora helva]
MDHPSGPSDTIPQDPSSVLSDKSLGSNSTIVASPATPAFRRPNSLRAPSNVELLPLLPSHSKSALSHKNADGLGIFDWEDNHENIISQPSLDRKASNAAKTSVHSLTSHISPVLSEEYEQQGNFSKIADEAGNQVNPSAKQSDASHFSSSASGNTYKTQREGPFVCKSKRSLVAGRRSCVTIAILCFSLYSTIFSALWLIIAIAKPRYGKAIATTGKITPQAASVLSTAIAKSIELSFTSVVVAFVGQVLSRRAIGDRHSITLAQVSMRSWILQPATILTNLGSIRYACITFLGGLTLVSAFMAMVYTTASDALVVPKLKLGASEDRWISGKVSTAFANNKELEITCPTPVRYDRDPDAWGATCIQIQHAGEAVTNYMEYFNSWQRYIRAGNLSADPQERPNPVGTLFNTTTTTVKGSWIKAANMTEDFNLHRRIVNNVTMAMPHSGVIAAARDEINGITQPSDVNGLGEYLINASVPSPVVNVQCAELTKSELKPMVYTLWDLKYQQNTGSPNSTSWPDKYNLTLPGPYGFTTIDDLFNFDSVQPHPIFPRLPSPYNTVLSYNATYGPYSIYLLVATETSNATENYTLCSLRAALTPDCSTHFHSTIGGSNLKSHCEDSHDRYAYSRTNSTAANGRWSADWKDVAKDWALGLRLAEGISDEQATNARLLSHLVLTKPALDPSLPSISEALAVLAGNTLLMSTLDSPFIHYWDYPLQTTILPDPQYAKFPAAFRAYSYQSGPSKEWQKIFYIVLSVVVAINIFCLGYFLVSNGLITDFTEPQNMFCLSMLSPPNDALAGACAGGPLKEHYAARWNIKVDHQREHLWIDSSRESIEAMRDRRRREPSSQQTLEYEIRTTPVGRAYSRIMRNLTSRL